MNIPTWTRYLIVLLFMGGVVALMYLSLPLDSRDKFIWMIQNVGGATLCLHVGDGNFLPAYGVG